MSKKVKWIGEAINRIDGFLKVTGRAKYSLDFPVKNIAYGYLFKSEVAAGKILAIDEAGARASKGVLDVITHKNAIKLSSTRGVRGGAMFQDNTVSFYGEHIGMIVAETFEQASEAAKLIKVKYEETKASLDFEQLRKSAPKSTAREDEIRGDAGKSFTDADFIIDEIYETAIEHHQPMSPHATIAIWESPNEVTVYNESQIVNGAQFAVAAAFGIDLARVRIISPHIGGGFGSKGGTWGHTVLAAMAAKIVDRPVKLALTRQMMFNSVGLRQRNSQNIKLSATKDGKLTGLAHETTTHCAIDQEFVEPCGDVSEHMYDVPNLKISYNVAPMNIILPTYTRAPGKSTGSFALESAIDELAYKLRIDPIELRIKNEPEKDPISGKPFSSRSLVECMIEGAKRFGWNRRKMTPRSVRKGDHWTGYGLGCGTYPARQRSTSAIVKLKRGAKEIDASVELAASDLGTGTYTVLAQVAAETLGLSLNRVGVKIGDSALPPAAGSVGSVGASSFCNAVFEACQQILEELQAKTDRQWFAEPTIFQLMEAANLSEFETRVDTKPLPEAENYASLSFNANFAEVEVSNSTGTVRVKRFVSATGAGRILNPKTAESQMHGGAVWGIGQALTEESKIDPRWGNFVTRTFADYHIPSNSDISEMETIFINEDDKFVNKLGIKGIGEVGIVGVSAAIANAVFNATGKRIRSLPITPDKLL